MDEGKQLIKQLVASMPWEKSSDVEGAIIAKFHNPEEIEEARRVWKRFSQVNDFTSINSSINVGDYNNDGKSFFYIMLYPEAVKHLKSFTGLDFSSLDLGFRPAYR